VPDSLTDEQVLFLSDIFPTGYMAADFCNIQGGDTIAIWGCGPVGQMAIRSAFLLGAERVIAIDTVPERLALAREAGAITIDFHEDDVYERIQGLTQGRGRMPASMPSARKRTRRPALIPFSTRQGCYLHGDGSAACAAPGHPLLPQLRHGLDRRRLRRLP
jgi:Zn-dependent alcohol dehydrogenase